MGWQGYYKILCKNGHLDNVQNYMQFEEWDEYGVRLCPPESWRCEFCDEPYAWYEIVDITNELNEGTPLEILTPQSKKFCEHCNLKITIPAVYKIPQKE